MRNGKSNGVHPGADAEAKLKKHVAAILDPNASYGTSDVAKGAQAQTKSVDVIHIYEPTFSTVHFQINSMSMLVHHAWGYKAINEMLTAFTQQQVDEQDGKGKGKLGKGKGGKSKRPPKDIVGEFLGSLHVIGGVRTVKLIDEREDVTNTLMIDGKATKTKTKSIEYGCGPWPVYAEGRFGFPTQGFKESMIAACRYVQGVTMAEVGGLIDVIGSDEDPELVEIVPTSGGNRMQMRLDPVRLSGFPPKPDIRFRGMIRSWTAKLTIKFNRELIKPESIANLIQIAGFHVGVGEYRPGKGGPWGKFQLDPKHSAIVAR